MLQMWPWKMSLLLEGNNNSKFQLLLTRQSSVFPSERIRLGGESEYVSSDYFPSSHPSILALPAPPLSAMPPQEHQPPPPLTHTPIGVGWGDKEGPGTTALWLKCLPHRFLSWSPWSPAAPCPLPAGCCFTSPRPF